MIRLILLRWMPKLGVYLPNRFLQLRRVVFVNVHAYLQATTSWALLLEQPLRTWNKILIGSVRHNLCISALVDEPFQSLSASAVPPAVWMTSIHAVVALPHPSSAVLKSGAFRSMR